MPPGIDPAQLASPTALGRLLTRLENAPDTAGELLASLPVPVKPVPRLGITGSPGVGKSTLLRRLSQAYRAQGLTVGVVAVDPTSPLSGGAILGDRLRIAGREPDSGLFIRSLGSRGSLGGVTPGASAVAAVLEAAGYQRILIETVGVGQTGYDVICLADTVVALFSPEGGDGVQLLKAGILEVGDIFAVNKSDRPGADAMLKEIRLSLELDQPLASEWAHHGQASATSPPDRRGEAMLRLSRVAEVAPPAPAAHWEPPVLRLTAEDGTGVDELSRAIDAHQTWLAALPADHPRRHRRLARELGFVLRAQLSRLLELDLRDEIESLAQEVQRGALPLWDAVERLRERVRRGL